MSNIITRWKEQLDARVAPYLPTALKQRDAVQVVLYLNKDGEVDDVKVNVKCQGDCKTPAK